MEMNRIPWSPVLWYATPLPINMTPFQPEEVRFLRFAVRKTPLDEQDPVSTVAGRTQGCFLCSVVCQASFPSAVLSKPSR